MRDILFRGKTDKGEWFKGQLLYFKASVGTGRLALIVEGCEWDNSNEWFNLGKRAKVIPETVGQFTGLTDKNGKKIFEGDMLRLGGDDLPHWHDEGKIVEVRYKNGGFEPLDDYDSDCGTAVVARCCEVIGNVYDNPELLNKN